MKAAAILFLVMMASVVAGAEARAVPCQRKTAEMGGVAVSVTPLNLAESGAATIDFQFAADTHAGALPSDMRAFTWLIGQGGTEIPPLAWSGGKGGHHLLGASFPVTGAEKKWCADAGLEERRRSE